MSKSSEEKRKIKLLQKLRIKSIHYALDCIRKAKEKKEEKENASDTET